METLPVEATETEALTPAQIRAIQQYLKNNSEAHSWLKLEQAREEVGGNRFANWGLDIVDWSKQSPGAMRKAIGIILPLGIAAALAYTTYVDVQYTLDVAGRLLPPALNNFLTVLSTPDFHLTDPTPLIPQFDFSRVNLNPFSGPSLDVRVQLPNPGAAFDPVIADHQRRVNEALDVVKQGVLKTASLAVETVVYGASAIFTAIKWHPFREIKSNDICFSEKIGWATYGLGSL